MKNIFYILILIITVSCAVKKTLILNSDEIERIEVYKGFPGTEIQMKNGFEKEFLSELIKSTELPSASARILSGDKYEYAQGAF